MPEGPECAVTAKLLDNFMRGKILTNVEILSGRYSKKTPVGFESFKSQLPLEIWEWTSKGKFIYGFMGIKPTKGMYVWNTLGMTGHWSFTEQIHARVRFDFQDGSSIWYVDTRNFGTLKFGMSYDQTCKKLNELGPDPLTHDIEINLFTKRLFSKNKKGESTICEALMNQKTISGIGNYIKAEVLWLSKISPFRKVKDLSAEEILLIRDNIQIVIRTSYLNGGATIKSFYGADGSKGTYSERFLVYNQKIDPYNNKVLKEETPDGRTTHWVPQIQK